MEGVKRAALAMGEKSVSKFRPERKMRTLGLELWMLVMPRRVLVYQLDQL